MKIGWLRFRPCHFRSRKKNFIKINRKFTYVWRLPSYKNREAHSSYVKVHVNDIVYIPSIILTGFFKLKKGLLANSNLDNIEEVW